jgi:NADH:ubiquinone oxidoreductase subunit 6 (subunit J)
LFIITVYAGGLAVLLVFVMMLVDLTNKSTPSFYSVVNSYIPYIINHLLSSLISPSVFRTISLYRRYLYISFFFLIFFFPNLEILYDKESIPSDIIHLSFFCRLIFEQVCISAYPYLRDCYFYVSSIDQSHYDFSYITELSDSSAISILDKVNLSTNLESIGDALYVYHSVNLLVLGLVLFTAIIGTLYLVLDINCHPLSQNLSKQISKGSKTIRILRN